MFDVNWWQKIAKALIASLITGILFLTTACGDRAASNSDIGAATQICSASSSKASGISEVSPPEVIQQLRQALEIYQPQVAILSPQADEVLQDNTVTVKLQVQDLPIFKNQELDMGPYLQAILDNQKYIAVYDLNQPLIFSDLLPGTHTLRVFASRPWHESFKNEGAYAQTTFHIFTKTQDNNPAPDKPLLTYSHPEGSYGAEPILLDFYLTNAPLHIIAQENPQDDIADWRIRCTINGNSFVMDRWQPLYLKGFKPGKNWVQLEFLDEQGNSVKNVFNNTVRLINYESKGKDTLAKLVRGELSAAEARGIVDPNYTAKLPTASPVPSVTPSPTPTPVPSVTPSPTPSAETTPEQVDEDEAATDVETEETDQDQTSKTESEKLENQKPGGFFNRFRRSDATPSPSLPPTSPEANEAPSPESIAPEVTPPQPKNIPEPQPEAMPQEETAPKTEQKPRGFFNRFRRPGATPSPDVTPTLPVVTPATPQLKSSGEPERLDFPTPSSELNTPVEEKPISP